MTLTTPAAQMATDVAIFYADGMLAVQAGTFTPADGSGASSFNARFYPGLAEESDGADELGQVGRLRIRVSDVATVATGDTWNDGSDTWEVLWAKLAPSNLEWICEISKR